MNHTSIYLLIYLSLVILEYDHVIGCSDFEPLLIQIPGYAYAHFFAVTNHIVFLRWWNKNRLSMTYLEKNFCLTN